MHKRNFWRGFAVALVAAIGVFCVVGCGGSKTPTSTSGSASSATATAGSAAGSAATAASSGAVRVATLKGPTSIGLAQLIQAAATGEAKQAYECTMYTSPADEVLPLLIKGDVDIATLPANVAAVAYGKTKGGVQVVDINTLGVLYLVTADQSVQSLADLAGRTLYVTNKGATPDYVTQYLLSKAGILDQVTIEYKDEPTEVVSALAADATAVGVLPEPFVTAATTKNESLRVVADLTEEWGKVATDGSQLVTGVTVVRTDFAKEHPEAVAQFLADHAASVEAVNADPATYGQVVADLGIVDAAPIATKAIPNCNLVCIKGAEMRTALEGYFKVLYDADPTSVGGSLPDDGFYYNV